ncbi:MAG: helix-turn-helix domain-containing protein, partial [Chitinophagaceae bacterium]
EESSESLHFMADKFGHYLERHRHLRFPHKHSFYHLVYFTKAAGRHSIDFVDFDAKPGQIYFMNPGQVHTWSFKGTIEGYIINFSAVFLQQLIADTRYLDQFAFFKSIAGDQVIQVPAKKHAALEQLFKIILTEQADKQEFNEDFIRTSLLQILFQVARSTVHRHSTQQNNYNALLFQNFRRLIDEHYVAKKLVRDYAAMLYITPNHLNALSKDVGGRPAGEMIRDRILLEAKRRLVNADMKIAAIAADLAFEDNSYFTKFFKKYEGLTPQEFRKQFIKN